jgi:2-dehydro-3-deoxygluconokinase
MADRPEGAVDLVTVGETLALFQPLQEGPMRFAPLFTRTMGKTARWISRLGADPLGDAVAGALAAEGVDISCVIRDPRTPTAVFFRESRGYDDPDVYYYRAGSAASRLCPEDIGPLWLEGARHLHMTGITPALGPGPAALTQEIMRQARARGLSISLDPNIRRKLWTDDEAREALLPLLPLCDIVMPGEDEAALLVGSGPVEAMANRLLSKGPQVAIIKRGSVGAVGLAAGAHIDTPACPVARVADTIGAGDAFAAGFLSVILDEPALPQAGSPGLAALLRSALGRAVRMGAMATRFRGDWEGLPTLSEIHELEAGQRRVTR